MPIITGQTAQASDFISASSGAGDAGKVPKLNSGGKIDTSFVFGGSGVDGALSITSGTTNINCGNAQVVIRNYTSISITGTGKLTFSNPATNGTVIVLRAQGNVTLTSSSAPMIDASNMGAAGGGNGSAQPGQNGIIGLIKTNGGQSTGTVPGGGGSLTAGQTVGGGSAGGAAATISLPSSFNSSYIINRYPLIFVGAGGGSGTPNGYQGGTGGNGGGALIIECGGAWNFTTTNGISVSGQNGGNGNGNGNGGAGGGGGYFNARYFSLTASTGTVISAGGNGGTGNGTGGYGGTGYSLIEANNGSI